MAKKRLIIIDDDKEFLEELKEMLNLEGYEVLSFTDGSVALDKISEYIPDIVLLDLKMEGISGFQMADTLMRFPETKDIPIIAMTGFFTLKEHSMLMRISGIKKTLFKPFNFTELLTEIEDISDKKLLNC